MRYYWLTALACCYKMGNMVKWCLCYAKNLPEVKAIVESFEGFGISATQEKVSLKTTGLATQLI